MTHAEWLAARGPDVPVALRAHVLALLRANPGLESLSRHEAFVEAADVLLRRVLGGDAASRATALDLLAADACITYAFEAASDEPQLVGERAEAAMRRIATVAAEFAAVPCNREARRDKREATSETLSSKNHA